MSDRANTSSDAGDAASRSDVVTGDDAGPRFSGPCSPPNDNADPPAKLSLTGCVDPANPRKFAAIVAPYEVNSPLWSDGALKTRGMVLPAGGKIHVKNCAGNAAECCVPDPNNYPQCLPAADDGKWVFPVGTVLIKNFLFNDDPADLTTTNAKFVETRLFMHVSDTRWVGYGYRWDEAQTDATLVPNERVKISFNTGRRTVTWNYPDRADCIKCHTPEANFSLGPETAQMNRTVAGMNQIDRLQALGLFETPPAKPYKAALVPPYAGQAGAPPASATLSQKARSYLHANCSFCHRPDGAFYFVDFRNDTSFAGTRACNQVPNKGDEGVAGATNISPGHADHSVLWLRMNRPGGDTTRMPQIGTDIVDTAGVKVVGDWINSLTSCP